MDNFGDIRKRSDLTYGRGYVYSIQYHIVWCTKYRKKVFVETVKDSVEQHLRKLACDYDFTIDSMEVMPDHVHLLVDCSPQFEIPRMIKILKGNIARWVFLEFPHLKAELCGGHLWNPSYCVVTVSDRSLEQVRHYIATQEERP
ncbi:MAG: IS200/IS605 family transposase [Desulfovibrio sp.]|nr:IS200/IS605 family transposase [Desulfovibrio sp.]